MNAEFLALSIVILLFSVILHEVCHGLMALRFGDRTAELAGRLTLNPIPHIDPVGTILLPLIFIVLPLLTGVSTHFFIGWAKPVPINPLHFKNIRTGELMVSLAGVGANFGLAILAAILYNLGGNLVHNSFLLEALLRFTVGINLMLGIFNLLPIPPLDGSKVLLSQLPYNLAREYERYSQYGIIILFALLYFGIISAILQLIIFPLYTLLGVPPL